MIACLLKAKIGDQVLIQRSLPAMTDYNIKTPFLATVVGHTYNESGGRSPNNKWPIVASNDPGTLNANRSAFYHEDLDVLSKNFDKFSICSPLRFKIIKIIKK